MSCQVESPDEPGQNGCDVTSISILHLEDSALDAGLTRERLASEGFECRIDRVETREEFTAALANVAYELILADQSLPRFDGLSALKIARELCPETPFIFVSGVMGEEVAIETLKQGATDYVLKTRLGRLGPSVRRALIEARERSERRRAEHALRVSEERFRVVFDQAFGLLAMMTPDGVVVDVNFALLETVGLPRDAIVGRPLWEAAWWGPVSGPREELRAGIARAAAGHRVLGESRVIAADGSERIIDRALTPIKDLSGCVQLVISEGRDVTERRRAEQALREADRRKDQFLAMLAHELRNPLSAIYSAIQLSRRPGREDERSWCEDVIERQAKHLSRLLDDLLDVSRISRGKVDLRKEPIELAPLLSRAVENVRSFVESRKHRVYVDVTSEPLWLDADPARLEQVVVNLLMNAAKYTEEGGQITLTARGDDDGFILIEVTDTGIGLPPEMLAHVFDPFMQLDHSLDRSQGGLGIGLTLVRSLVELHGGQVSASSDGLGCGSTFRLLLPARSEAPPARSSDQQRSGASSKPKRILVVDDNEDTARALSRLLKLAGHDVKTVHDGATALVVAQRDRPEIVLMDIGLPGLDGYTVAEALRRDPALDGIVLVAVSGYGQPEDRRRSRESGFDHHIIKPVDYNALTELLARIPSPRIPNT